MLTRNIFSDFFFRRSYVGFRQVVCWNVQGVQSQAPGIQTGTLVDLGDTHTATALSTAEVNGQAADPSSASAGKPSDEDFDMFAQSRQSFEQNLPRAKYA